jgi:hypothetical protein
MRVVDAIIADEDAHGDPASWEDRGPAGDDETMRKFSNSATRPAA